MRLYGVEVDPVATSWLAEPSSHRWAAFGPAAGRAAIPLAIDQSDPVRALNYVAGSRGARSEVLATLADRWLETDISRLVEAPQRRVRWAAQQVSLPPAANPGAGPWNGVWTDANLPKLLSAEARDLRRLLPAEAFKPATTPTTAARLAHDIFALPPIRSGPFMPRQTLYATAAQAAENAEPASQQLDLPGAITSDHFKAAAGILGAGAAGVIAGGIAAAVGAPAMVALGLGAAAGSAALWWVTSKLPRIDLREVWTAFTGWIGKAVDGLINFRAPGSGPADPDLSVASEGKTPAADALGTLVTTKNPSVVGAIYRALA